LRSFEPGAFTCCCLAVVFLRWPLVETRPLFFYSGRPSSCLRSSPVFPYGTVLSQHLARVSPYDLCPSRCSSQTTGGVHPSWTFFFLIVCMFIPPLDCLQSWRPCSVTYNLCYYRFQRSFLSSLPQQCGWLRSPPSGFSSVAHEVFFSHVSPGK